MNKWKWVLVTLFFAIPAFLTGKMIWPPNHEMMPTATQLPFFIILSAVESLMFGLGVSFLLFGYSLVKKSSKTSRKSTFLVYLSIAWILISWWSHDNTHASNGMNLQGLLYIEYGYHLTLMIAGVILAHSFFKNSKRA